MTFFGSDTFERRRAAACKFLAANHLRAVIIGPGPEFEYLTGTQIDTHERLSAIVLTDEGNATVVLPSTDAGSFPSDDPALIPIGWRDGEDPYEIVYKLIASPADSATPPIIGLGSTLTADHVLALQRYPFKTCLAQDALSSLFMVKDDDEIAQLAQAAEAIDRVHALVPSLLTPGITERAVADALHTAILEEHTAVDFIIVGSGPNGANPHHDFSDRIIEAGDIVVVDIGGTIASGYHSDCTRTYLVEGAPGSQEQLDAYEVLLQAQQAACDAARPGMRAEELDAVARNIISEHGYGEWFTHRIGHGIGLAGHEPPFLVTGNDLVLDEGMVFSIEPGIYKPGSWGMRIEDIVHLQADGAHALNTRPKTLQPHPRDTPRI
ncbi:MULTISPECIES: Xaa-Pro peptidase family protein [Corynebacterium]|uniref:Aminopeptidase P family protein n=1 Tax=Corynebacterium pseudogenitalium TaxID=38303 RepID=A0ABD4TQW3_9CORY|nr:MULTISPECIES: Xaa-Pro peptidase family protein [Corynebacterium]MCQ4611306.1 aminopeptidase P family protein [Corynebacterium sp. CCUG 51687]MCQ4613176.1 aminopeptidase P family protein [Corynebacterium pseudogenitalium]